MIQSPVIFDVCLSMMAHFTDDDNQALGYLDQAREEAVKADRPIGIYYVQEFEFRLSRGMTDGLPELLQTIQTKYLNIIVPFLIISPILYMKSYKVQKRSLLHKTSDLNILKKHF